MKLKQKAVEVPQKIRSFIDNVTAVPLENIEDPLRCFVWEFDKGDFHHWVDLFNHFDLFFEQHVKSRKDLQLEDKFLGHDPPFPKAAVLQILRAIRIILENCANKHFCGSYEQHFSSLLASTDVDVVEACLQTLAAFLKKAVGKGSIRDATVKSKLFALSQGWGGKEQGLGLVACAAPGGCEQSACDLGCTLHFEFYEANEGLSAHQELEQATQGLHILHFPDIHTCLESDLELFSRLIEEYKVPCSLRFSLLTRLRFARAFSSLASRQQFTCIRLYAFIVLVKVSTDGDDLVSFFNSEPEFINELLELLSHEEAVPENIRILCLLSLVALCQDRSRQSAVLTAVSSSGYRGMLASLVQKAIDSVISGSSKWSVVFAEALLSLVTSLVTSSTGCSAMMEAGLIATLLPLLKDKNLQHLHLVCTAVHILEAFMDYSNPAAALFGELGGLDDIIVRLNEEVSHVDSGFKSHIENGTANGNSQVDAGTSRDLDNWQPLHSESLVSHHRKLLMKALLRVISLGTYAPGDTASIHGSFGSLLSRCLSVIFSRAKDFGGGVFSLAATVTSDLIHKDPTCFSVLDAAGLPSAFLDSILDGVVCSVEAIACIPHCLDALCLNNNGLQAVKDRNALRCFVKIFTSRAYLCALTADTSGSVSSGLDELLRHASALRGLAVDMLIEILGTISNIGSRAGCSSLSVSTDSLTLATSIPMETDTGSSQEGSLPQTNTSDSNAGSSMDDEFGHIEGFLPHCVSNIAHLLETVLQNAETCRTFVEKKGIEAVLQLLTLPVMPLSASLGYSLSIAFKNFSIQHTVSLARALCSFIKEQLRITDDLLEAVGSPSIMTAETNMREAVLRNFFILEGALSLSNYLLKVTTALFSEVGAADADVLKGIGRIYREIIWQLSVCASSKVEERSNLELEEENLETCPSAAVGTESDDNAIIPSMRYMNPVSLRNGSQSSWNGEREFISIVRSGEALRRRSRYAFTRIRGGRAGRHSESFDVDFPDQMISPETLSQDLKKKSPEVLVYEVVGKLALTLRSFFVAIVKGFTSSSRRRGDSGSLVSTSKVLGSALAKIFLEALTFTGHRTSEGLDMSLSVKCRYLGKVVDDMAAITVDSKRQTCNATMVNYFYVHGIFKELLATFDATSQLLWTPTYTVQTSRANHDKVVDERKLPCSPWLFDTLLSYCRELEYFVSSSLLLSSPTASQTLLLVEPASAGLSLGLFPLPRDPEVFVQMLQAQVMDVILTIWNHQMFPNCDPSLVSFIISLMTHVYSGTGDLKQSRDGTARGIGHRHRPPPLDEATISTIIEMGFTRARAEEALRRVETNSVEMAMEWLFTHAEDPVQDDDELARALALSLGSSSDSSKAESVDKLMDVTGDGVTKLPPIDDILSASTKFFGNSDVLSFAFVDLFATFCTRNNGIDRPKVVRYLILQLKLCQLEFPGETNTLCMISRILAALLSEDRHTRQVAAENGIVSPALEILLNFKYKKEWADETLVPKCTSALLLILDNMLQSEPRVRSDVVEGSFIGSLDSSSEKASLTAIAPFTENKTAMELTGIKPVTAEEKMFGRPTSFLTVEESHKLLEVCCDLIKEHVPALIMQAVLQICARLTKVHALALQFLEKGVLASLFTFPKVCFFHGYDTIASVIIRHLLEDPQTLQTAMELEIRQTISETRHAGHVSPKNFLETMMPVTLRDPAVFMKAAVSVCQLDASGGRNFIVLSKEKERSKPLAGEPGVVLVESGHASDNKGHDGSAKCVKVHKKVPANLIMVIDQLLDIVMKFHLHGQEDCLYESKCMDVDGSSVKTKGKMKIHDSGKSESEPDKSAALAKVTFVLKLLGEILLMYSHAVGVLLKRDFEMCQVPGANPPDGSTSFGLLQHVLHHLLPLSAEKSAGPDEWRTRLSEKSSWFLIVLCGRSGEGRKRVIYELIKTLSSFSNLKSKSSRSALSPDKRILVFAELAYSVLSKTVFPGNLPVSGCSPDIAKSMIDGGMVNCLTGILQVIDLDHPDAPKIVNVIVKSLESLTRAANMSEQVLKPDTSNKKRVSGLNVSVAEELNRVSSAEVAEPVPNRSSLEDTDLNDTQESLHQVSSHAMNDNHRADTDMRVGVTEPIISSSAANHEMDFIRDQMRERRVSHHTNHIEVIVDGRTEDDMGDDDDIGDDGEDEDDDDDDDGEDEDEAEDGTRMMSLAETDVDDHDDTGLGDESNDEIIDEGDDDFHENRVIEVRWREPVDGLDHRLPAISQHGATGSLIDDGPEPFEGANMDDLLGLHGSLGSEQRHQATRSSFEQSTVEASGFQHPLLVRPNASGNIGSVLLRRNSSRNLDSLTSESFDASHFFLLEAPVLRRQLPRSLFHDHLGASRNSPFSDYTTNLDSMQLIGRRGPGDGRWADDGRPHRAQTIAIPQAMEEHFLSQLRQNLPVRNNPNGQSQDQLVEEKELAAPPTNDCQQTVQNGITTPHLTDNVHEATDTEIANQGTGTVVGSNCLQAQVCQESFPRDHIAIEPISFDSPPDQPDTMETDDGDDPIGGDNAMVLDFVIPSTRSDNDVENALRFEPEDVAPTLPIIDDADNQVTASSCPGRASEACASTVQTDADVDMNNYDSEGNQVEQSVSHTGHVVCEPSSSMQNLGDAQNGNQADHAVSNSGPSGNTIDPTFLEALPEDLRTEVLASQQAQPVQPQTYVPPSAEEIDPEFLAALPPEIQAEVLAQQRVRRGQQLAQPVVDMDNASIIATFPDDLREEVLLTSSEAVLSGLPSPLLAEAHILRDRAMSHYQARSLFGGIHRLNNRRNGLGFERQSAMDRGVGVTIGRRNISSTSNSMKGKEFEGEQLLDMNALKAVVHLLRLAQPLGKGMLQRLLLNLCAHRITRANIVRLFLNMVKPEAGIQESGLKTDSNRLYGCQPNIVYSRSQLLDGLPPVVLRRVLEIMTYLAANHSSVADMLFCLESVSLSDMAGQISVDRSLYKGKEKLGEAGTMFCGIETSEGGSVPVIILLKLLNVSLVSRSTSHFEQVLGLLRVVVFNAASKLDPKTHSTQVTRDPQLPKKVIQEKREDNLLEDSDSRTILSNAELPLNGKRSLDTRDVFLLLPQSDLRNLSNLLGYEGLSDKAYVLAGDVLKKMALVTPSLRKLFISELSQLTNDMSSSAVRELSILRNTQMLGLSAGSMAGAAILRVLQALSSLISGGCSDTGTDQEEQANLWKLNLALEALWQELSNCISMIETRLGQGSSASASNANVLEHLQLGAAVSKLPLGTERLLPYIEAFFVICEKLQAGKLTTQLDQPTATAIEVDSSRNSTSPSRETSGDCQKRHDGTVMFTRFAEKHRRLLNAFIRQNPGSLENSLSMMLEVPRLVDFDNKKAYFRSKVRQQHEHHITGPLRISVRRAYILEDSYNQLRMRSAQELRGRLNVQFQGEEGIDAGGLTREWYQLLSRVIFDRGALLFTAVGNSATFQPNPNSVYQTEHLSYFKFVGRVVAKALFDGQLLDVHFTRSFYKHILGIKVTYHDIEAVDPDYYKNLKWLLENDVSEILDLTFSMDADEEKHILYEKNEVTDYELKPGGRNIRVTEETKHEYVDLVAEHILTNAITPQINSFLKGFNELIPRELISIFHEKEIELLISGLPEIDLHDLKANTDYTGYTAASPVVQWFWEVVTAFNKEDMARLLQFITGTSKVPLEGFRALQGISGPQKFQIHKAYGASNRLPSAHTCFNQLDLPEYGSKEQLQDRLLLAIHEANEGFGFG
ncbi:hypothetical protein MLD38_000898 [Melastoma candidum]|uniref:Uncharacterized protein n=1 Tax=Melastoma candidum TaxID=119954 RepID=A0ACB9SBY7_9MYRT|nr:hypothetical protein MLD38_000898 [Melastoma candidum]